ncbi:hypothetical protein B0T25DRAFT_549108 [Lasiosphaeria hispida]|uniref:Uncharacterized protein n=1 Tax=Lasiosphaeria hispida TaxID=260671 RepID=A0AAJ0MCQ4_9PEZI|nr:hypothetical protein B0T25DRAFT_549108 [Lasiosphaeria hispida]
MPLNGDARGIWLIKIKARTSSLRHLLTLSLAFSFVLGLLPAHTLLTMGINQSNRSCAVDACLNQVVGIGGNNGFQQYLTCVAYFGQPGFLEM